MIFRDFNDLLHKSYKWELHVHPQCLMDRFKFVIENIDLFELELCRDKFSWERCRGKKDWVKEKLDRAFGTMAWLNKFPLCKPIVLVLLDRIMTLYMWN